MADSAQVVTAHLSYHRCSHPAVIFRLQLVYFLSLSTRSVHLRAAKRDRAFRLRARTPWLATKGFLCLRKQDAVIYTGFTATLPRTCYHGHDCRADCQVEVAFERHLVVVPAWRLDPGYLLEPYSDHGGRSHRRGVRCWLLLKRSFVRSTLREWKSFCCRSATRKATNTRWNRVIARCA